MTNRKQINRYVKLILGLYAAAGLVFSLALTAFVVWAIFTFVTNAGV